MKKLNFRHSLATMNRHLSNVNQKFNFIMEGGKPVYILKEANDTDGKLTKTCGFYGSATDAVEYVNKVCNAK